MNHIQILENALYAVAFKVANEQMQDFMDDFELTTEEIKEIKQKAQEMWEAIGGFTTEIIIRDYSGDIKFKQ